MGLKDFGTNKGNEKDGLWFEVDDEIQVKLRRAGGGNKAFEKMTEALLKPQRRRLASGNLSVDKIREINRECFLKTVICGWRTLVNGTWCDGITPWKEEEDGTMVVEEVEDASDLLPVSPENLRKVLQDFPELFDLLTRLADDASAFREESLKDEGKN